MATQQVTLLGPSPTEAGVPFRGIVTDSEEGITIGVGTGVFANLENGRSSGSSIAARLGGVALITGFPDTCTTFIDFFVPYLNGITYIVAVFGDGTHSRTYASTDFVNWVELSAATGFDDNTRFVGVATDIAWASIKTPRSFMSLTNGVTRDILVLSDGTSVRVYDPQGDTAVFWKHLTPLYPDGAAAAVTQTNGFLNFVQLAGATRVYPTGGLINQGRFNFADSTAIPYDMIVQPVLSQTTSAQASDLAQFPIDPFTPTGQIVTIIQASTAAMAEDMIQNDSIQVSTGIGNLPIVGATGGTPVSVEMTSHPFSTGDVVTIIDNVIANGTWTITKVDANHFTLDGSSTPTAPVAGGRFTFNVPGSHHPPFGKDITLATPGSPITVTWPTTSPAVPNGALVSFYGNSVVAGITGTITLGPVVPPHSSLTIDGSTSPTGTVLGGFVENAITIYDPTSSTAKIASPVSFRQMGGNTDIEVQYEVVFDISMFTAAQLAGLTLIQFTRLAPGIDGTITILNMASGGVWNGTSGSAISYGLSNAFAESPGFVAIETTATLSSFGGPAQVSSTGNVSVGLQTATGGSGSTIDGVGLTASTLIGQFVSIVDGTGAGDPARQITANTTTVITVSPNFATTPDNTSVFYVSDSPRTTDGSPQLPIALEPILYDLNISVKNPWIQPNNATPGFTGGLGGVPDCVNFYMTPAGSRSLDQNGNLTPGTYGYLCSSALVTPTVAPAAAGWDYAFPVPSDPAVFMTTQKEFLGLDKNDINPLRLLPTSYQQAIPAASWYATAFKRLFAAQPVQDGAPVSGAVWFSAQANATRFQETALDRQGNVDDTLGSSATFSGKVARSLIGSSVGEGTSFMYALTDSTIEQFGGITTSQGGVRATTLETPQPIANHGTNAPRSLTEYLGLLYWIDQFGAMIAFDGSTPTNLSRRKVGDKFRDLPVGRIPFVCMEGFNDRVYCGYTPVGETGNGECLLFNTVTGFFESVDTMPGVLDFGRIRRGYDPTKPGSGQRLFVMSDDATLIGYEESATTEFGGPTVAFGLRTGIFWSAKGPAFFKRAFVWCQRVVGGAVDVIRHYLETGNTGTTHIALVDPDDPTLLNVANYDSLSIDEQTGQGSQRMYADYQAAVSPGWVLDRLDQEIDGQSQQPAKL